MIHGQTKNPFLHSYLERKGEIDEAIHRVLESGNYILGNEVRQFEEEFSGYIGTKSGVGVGSGTDALTIALKACEVGIGDEVITVSNTAVATVAAIELTGATPVFVEVNPYTFTMEPECFYKAITPKTKAVVPVHLYGQPAQMMYINEIAKTHNIFVVEDCAQSHGAMIDTKKTGTFGDISAFSFYPTKNLGAIGDGGMIVTDNKPLAEKAELIRQYGWTKTDRSNSLIKGMNSRLDEIQAAILRVKLRYLDKDNEQRRKIAKVYDTNIDAEIVLPEESKGTKHVYHQYVIQSAHRDELRTYLTKNGIDTGIHYPRPVHLQLAYRDLPFVSLPITEQICKDILSLPMHPSISESDAQKISAGINAFYRCA